MKYWRILIWRSHAQELDRQTAKSSGIIDIIPPCTGIGNGVFWGGLANCAVMEQFSVKHPHTGHYQVINPYTIIADNDTFCIIFVNGYLRIAKVYPRGRPSMKMVCLAVDNKMKLRGLWEAWEVRQFRLSNLNVTTKMVFVPPLTYQTSRNLLDPTVNYRTMGPYLPSRRHQRG